LTLQAVAVLVLAAMVALFAQSLLQNSTTVYAQLKDGRAPTAPNFTAPALLGRGDITLSRYRGRVVLLNLWASWCTGCQAEAPVFNQAMAEYRSRGVVVLGVDTNDFVSDGRGFARTYHDGYPLVHDSGGIAARWGFGTGLPVTYVIDRSGVVRHLFDGLVTSSALASVLRPMLAGAS